MARIRLLNADPVGDYREACKITQGIDISMEPLKPLKTDMVEWWIKQIIANHSTLRSVRFRIIAAAPRSVIMQMIRATKGNPQPEVESSRPDWTGTERSADPYELKLYSHDHTAESFRAMASQRLCNRTEARTRGYMRDLVAEMAESPEPFFRALAACCNPPCSMTGYCPEIKGCGQCPRLADEVIKVYCHG